MTQNKAADLEAFRARVEEAIVEEINDPRRPHHPKPRGREMDSNELAMIGMAIEALDQVECAEEGFRQAAAERGLSREQADLILRTLRERNRTFAYANPDK